MIDGQIVFAGKKITTLKFEIIRGLTKFHARKRIAGDLDIGIKKLDKNIQDLYLLYNCDDVNQFVTFCYSKGFDKKGNYIEPSAPSKGK